MASVAFDYSERISTSPTTEDAFAELPYGCSRIGMNPDARELCDRLFGPDVSGSHTRAWKFVVASFSLPTHVFWPSFLYTWSGCDCTWPVKPSMLDMLRYHHRRQRSRAYLSPTAARFFDGLPGIVQVWRGCASYRVRGLSWTIDESVARRFASGMRSIAKLTECWREGLYRKSTSLLSLRIEMSPRLSWIHGGCASYQPPRRTGRFQNDSLDHNTTRPFTISGNA
jgi:hypothetical protein